MSLSSIGSYVTTTQAFVAHWNEVNTFLGAPGNALKLSGPYEVTDLEADLAALETALDLVIARDNGRQTAAGTRDSQKATMIGRLKQFRAAVQGIVGDPGFVNALPVVPQFGAAPTKFVGAFSDMHEVWTQVDAATTVPGFTAPLLLGSYALAGFTTDLASLRTSFENARKAEEAATIARKQRDAKMAAIKKRLQQYGKVVLAKLGPGDPLVDSVPSLTPAPGSTPAAVTLSAAIDSGTGDVHLEWTACAHPHLSHYSLRGCAGGGYKAADETVIATIPKAELSIDTTWGLAAPGSKASYKVYAVTDTDNEKGSNAVGVTRPAA